MNVLTRGLTRAAIAVMRLESIAAAQHHSHGDIGNQPQAHGIEQRPLQPLHQRLVVGSLRRVPLRKRPVLPPPHRVGGKVVHQGVPLRQLLDAADDAPIVWHVAEGQIHVEGIGVEHARATGIREERLQLGPERKFPIRVAIKERLLAGPVAREKNRRRCSSYSANANMPLKRCRQSVPQAR